MHQKRVREGKRSLWLVTGLQLDFCAWLLPFLVSFFPSLFPVLSFQPFISQLPCHRGVERTGRRKQHQLPAHPGAGLKGSLLPKHSFSLLSATSLLLLPPASSQNRAVSALRCAKPPPRCKFVKSSQSVSGSEPCNLIRGK